MIASRGAQRRANVGAVIAVVLALAIATTVTITLVSASLHLNVLPNAVLTTAASMLAAVATGSLATWLGVTAQQRPPAERPQGHDTPTRDPR